MPHAAVRHLVRHRHHEHRHLRPAQGRRQRRRQLVASFSGNTLNVGTSAIANCGVGYNCGSFTNALVNPNSFGFYFKASPASQTYYSLDQLNAPVRARTASSPSATAATTNWLFAYEDGSDFDYNDMAVKVESITVPVPEPESYALMLAGLAAMGVVARRRRAPR